MKLDLEILEAIYTNQGNDLRTIAEQNTVMLIFLRHFGCMFCREALDDFSKIKEELTKQQVKLVFVHMSEEEMGNQYLKDYGLEGEEHISDPDLSLYEYFGLHKGGFGEMFGLKVWARFFAVKQKAESPKPELGNHKQMPGVFLIEKGKVTNSFVHQSIADKPDYLSIAKCERLE